MILAVAAVFCVTSPAGSASGGSASAAAAPRSDTSPRPRATATTDTVPGMGAPQACSSTISYSVNGKTRLARPLPPAMSKVGGDRLAAAGLQLTPSATTPPPAPKATAWLVADLGTGRVLASCNAHVPLAPASSLKVLTALALAHKFPPATRYVARAEDAAVDGTRVGLVPRSVYTADDLWHALLMSSANDAATGLAAMAGGTDAATEIMNQTARTLGVTDTRALNTSGLDQSGQVSSAYDLAVFGRAALADPVITRYFQTRNYAFPEAGTEVGGRTRKTFQIQNHDKLLLNYPGALGIKNGWTSTTGGSFIGAAERGGRRLVVTVLAADPQTWQMSAALLDWAFGATRSDAESVGELVTGPVGGGATGGSGGQTLANGRHATATVDAKAEEGMSVARLLALVAGGVGTITVVGLLGRATRRRRAGLAPAADDPWHRRRSR